MEAIGREPVLARARLPLLPQAIDRDVVVLALAGCQRGGAARRARVLAALVHALLDLHAPTREMPEHPFVDALDLRRPLLHRPPPQPELPADPMTEFCVVEVAGGLRVPVDRPAVQCRPATLSARRVRDDRMGVQLRVARATGAMTERRDEQPVATQEPPAALAAPRERRLTLQVPKRRRDRLVVCGAHHPGRLCLDKAEQDRNGLRCTERQVKPRDVMLALRLPQPRLAAVRRRAGEHRRERLIINAALEPQQPCAAPGPHPGSLAGPLVVVLPAPGDSVGVIPPRLRRPRELSDRQHTIRKCFRRVADADGELAAQET